MRTKSSGFTLIELLIVISIIGLLAAVLLPNIIGAQNTANVTADVANMKRIYEWFEMYRQKHRESLPNEGGHRYVLSLWTSGVAEHTEENFDRFFTPGIRGDDVIYADLRKRVAAGENPWPNIDSVDSACTHYVGRAKQHMKTRTAGSDEAWVANDNEDVWSHRDGTVNVLFNGGTVRTYSYQVLQEQYGLGELDKNNPVKTWGSDSPIVPCQKLDN